MDDVTVSNESGGPDPVVVNSGFESSAGWTEAPSSAFPGTSFYRRTWGTATPRSGDYAYALGNQLYGWLKSDQIPVSPGADYDLYTYLRGEIDPDDDHYGGWLVSARFYDSGGSEINRPNAAGGDGDDISTFWSKPGGTVTAPEGAATMRVYLNSYMVSGWLGYDDVSLSGASVTK